MQIIGLSGKKHSGKTTAANLLAEYVYETYNKHVAIIGFADAVKNELAEAFCLPLYYIENHKQNFRLIMQGYGTDYRRELCGQDYWIKKVEEKLAHTEASLVIIPDVRFLNELKAIQDWGGEVWRLSRHDDADAHESETQLDEYQFPVVIDNNKTLTHLKRQLIDNYAIYSSKHPLT